VKISVIVPAHNANTTLPRLFDSLSNQTLQDFEIIVVDDCSTDNTSEIIKAYNCNFIQLNKNHGPAYCRNKGAQHAQGDILVFTDSDCEADTHWLKNIQKHFSQNDTEAIMGRLVLLPSNILGDSISALGFPGGGAIGFDKIWKVDQKGFTDSISSCNFAIPKNYFWEIGGFDESFPFPGGEDSLLAYHLRRLNYRIKYCQDVLVYHAARDSMNDFLKWQFRRGMSSFIFSTKVSNKRNFLSLRVWSTKNIIRHSWGTKKFLLVLFLLGTSFVSQFFGFIFAKHRKERYASSNY
jgi:glycosyltransferase involved in cell wall biosynthesis